MSKIFKRRMRRPVVLHKGSMRRTPNFYPQFYDEGGSMNVPAGANVYAGDFSVRTSFHRNAETGEFDKEQAGAGDAVSTALTALEGAGQITQGAMNLAQIADTSSVEDQIDEEFNSDFDSASDNDSLLASFGNTGNLKSNWKASDVRGLSSGGKALGVIENSLAGAASGAAAGSLGDGFGAAIGAGVGFLAGLGSGIGGMVAGDKKAQRKAESLNAMSNAANRYALNSFDSANKSLADKNWKSNLVNLSEHGGTIHINPANRGKFTASARRAGMGTQEYARHVLANKENYDATTVRRANFARNASHWKHAYGGSVYYDGPGNTTSGNERFDPATFHPTFDGFPQPKDNTRTGFVLPTPGFEYHEPVKHETAARHEPDVYRAAETQVLPEATVTASYPSKLAKYKAEARRYANQPQYDPTGYLNEKAGNFMNESSQFLVDNAGTIQNIGSALMFVPSPLAPLGYVLYGGGMALKMADDISSGRAGNAPLEIAPYLIGTAAEEAIRFIPGMRGASQFVEPIVQTTARKVLPRIIGYSAEALSDKLIND